MSCKWLYVCIRKNECKGGCCVPCVARGGGGS